ncbi:LysR family transcriptional regulator [uncultured Litoreibacter sp.]|uniref:LysR family transcriptional regulator n=1 Tax=uncultured Litoreibacter sp. TaxID=1392394 RepID=UPI0026132E2F|nr:LysR family transcriptional regulator [uncultured Litoreibacter sp.]
MTLRTGFAKMNSTTSWDDLRLVLAIFDAGSLSGAGRILGSSHATVFRRLNAIEQKLGVSLFQRGRTGYTPTLAGEEVAAAGRKIAAQVNEVERSIIGQDLRPSGTVRLTTLDSLLVGLLSPLLASFQRSYPEVLLEVSVSNHLYDLSRREADVAIRPTSKPSEALFGRKVATLNFAVYGAKSILPDDVSGLRFEDFPWIGPDGAMIYPELTSWMTKRGLDAHCRHRVDSVLGMFAAAQAGQGLCVLPRYLGDPAAALICVSDNLPEIETELWMVTHSDLRKTARVRALMDVLGGSIAQQVKRQSGP